MTFPWCSSSLGALPFPCSRLSLGWCLWVLVVAVSSWELSCLLSTEQRCVVPMARACPFSLGREKPLHNLLAELTRNFPRHLNFHSSLGFGSAQQLQFLGVPCAHGLNLCPFGADLRAAELRDLRAAQRRQLHTAADHGHLRADGLCHLLRAAPHR